MRAAKFVGRVGGLAVALGVGAAVFTGYGVAWADGTGTGAGPSSTSSPAGSESKAPAGGTGVSPRSAASSASGGVVSTGGTRSSSRSKGHSRADVARSRVGSTPAANDEPSTGAATSARADNPTPANFAAATDSSIEPSPVKNSSPVPAPVVDAVAAVQPAAKPAPAPAAAVSGFLTTAVNDVLKPFSGNNPVAPVDSPLALALVAFTRREAANAAAGSSTPSALTTTSLLGTNPLTITPKLSIIDGIVNGTTNAVDSTGTPLTYTLVSSPSAGGKVTFSASADTKYVPGKFTYLPDQSVLASGNEQFTILVAQNTQFDQALTAIPIAGSLVPQTLVILHQAPVLGDVLAPLIGYSQLATFDSNTVLPSANPVAFTYKMPSFDGTLISVNWFPAANVGPDGVRAATKAPTILNGPGLANAGQTDPYTPDGINGLTPGVQTLRNAGYNVVTWDPRGEFASGGVLQLDSPFFEGRDVSSIISWVAKLPTTQLDSTNDPRVGMVGGSYGGGIQLTTAATDPRIDAIAPGIAWNSLNNSLYPNSAFKTSYASLLLLSLVTSGARINNQIYPAFITGGLLGVISQTAQALLASSGPTSLLNQLQAPTLLIQGTVDVLFPLQQAIDNAQTITSNPYDTPLNMIWYCGGHGACLTTPNTTGTRNIDATMAWLDQYVKQDPSPTVLPKFQYTDQYGTWFKSNYLPTPGSAFYGSAYQAVTGASGGLLPIVPILGGSGPASPQQVSLPGSLVFASKADNAINVTVPTKAGAQYVGAPTLSFDYQGLGTSRFVYAQLVDNKTGLVVGNLVTPVPVTLDGQSHTVSVPIADIVYTVKDPSTDNLTLQITSSATAYENFTSIGVVNISNVGLTLPTPATISPE